VAKRVGGSLADARNVSSQLGRALEIVGLLGAIGIACLLTLTSVTKRVREIGTLRAIGWSRGLVVRQIGLETLVQAVMGGVVGIVLGFLATRAIDVAGWTLKATVAGPTPAGGPFSGGFGGFGFGRFAPSPINAGSSLVKITAPIDPSLILLAVVLAVAAGVIAGVIGGLRAAQLRPAAALRSVE
jgi:ABC-type antimicrobial peptide transport system permease subunit